MRLNRHSLTICIPTCYGGSSLVAAVESLRSSAPNDVKLLVVADSRPLSSTVKMSLKKLRVRVIENRKPSSQIAKIKQMLKLVDTEYIIFTQDDITVDKNCLSAVRAFWNAKPNITMITVKNNPTSTATLVDFALMGGTYVAEYIEEHWNGGQNYLRGCGRLLGFKTSFMRKFRIPESIVNVDAYFYFENKRLGGTFDCVEQVYMYYSLPKTLSEQIRKSSRYQYCFEEMSRHFDNITGEFYIPLKLKIIGLLSAFLSHPGNILTYLPFLAITRLYHEKKKDTESAMWKVDTSTK